MQEQMQYARRADQDDFLTVPKTKLPNGVGFRCTQ